MVKHLIALIAASGMTSIASAQTFPKPPDVPAYVAVTPSWASGSTPNTQKGPGDIPPGDALELADVPSLNRPQLLKTDGISFCLTSSGGSCQEAKFRSHLEVTHVLYDDPVRNYGQPGTSHCHTFFGNRSVNAYSTFATLRNRARQYSRAGGGGLNGTGYWMPCMIQENAFGDGKNYVALPGAITLYYAEEPALAANTTYLLLGLRYVTGFNMDDGGAYFDSVLAAANSAAGYARYTVTNQTAGNSLWLRHSWTCVGATNQTNPVRALVNADGSDPWGGTCTSDRPLQLSFNGASCWDGRNLWSPGGYKNVIPAIFDTVANAEVCPQNYWRLPALQLNMQFKHNGFAQFSKWKLASDGIVGNANTATVGGKTVRRGETFHTDWFNGWDRAALRSWLDFCIGVRGQTTRQCDNGTIGAAERLVTIDANPQTGKSPQVVLDPANRTNQTASEMVLLPANAVNGGTSLHVHGN